MQDMTVGRSGMADGLRAGGRGIATTAVPAPAGERIGALARKSEELIEVAEALLNRLRPSSPEPAQIGRDKVPQPNFLWVSLQELETGMAHLEILMKEIVSLT